MQVKHFIPLLTPIEHTFAGVDKKTQADYLTTLEWMRSKSEVELTSKYAKEASECLKETTGKDFDCKARALGLLTLAIKEEE